MNEVNFTKRGLETMGHREIDELIKILEIYNKDGNGTPEDFIDNDVVFEFNSYSGCVYLTNSEWTSMFRT